MKLVFIGIVCFLLLVLIVILFGVFRTIQIQHSKQQKEFINGKIPKEMQNGLYKGTVSGLKTSWQGKRFNRSTSSGINIFKDNNKPEQYAFKTYIGKGIQDKDLNVIKIDYSGNKDPWWLRFILDEIVEIAPKKFLGKVHIVAFPFLPFSLGYFRLEQ